MHVLRAPCFDVLPSKAEMQSPACRWEFGLGKRAGHVMQLGGDEARSKILKRYGALWMYVLCMYVCMYGWCSMLGSVTYRLVQLKTGNCWQLRTGEYTANRRNFRNVL